MSTASIISMAGIVLSAYALYVEYKVHHLAEGEEFTAMCDIEAISASCSSVFQLPQGHLISYFGLVPDDHILNVPNAFLGVLYYTYQLIVRHYMPHAVTVSVAMAAMASSLFLAYHLTLLHELCILCWTTHVLNATLLYDTLTTTKSTRPAATKEKTN